MKKDIKNVYMMGFMCVGKTKVGRLLALRLNWKFVDIDACIVRESGLSIPEIFESRGESVFRDLEKSWITKISKQRRQVISLGGGAVTDPENWERIASSGVTVTLAYPPEIILRRAVQKTDRPLLKGTDAEKLARIHELLEKRSDFYQRADLVLFLNKEIQADLVADMIAGYLGVWQ
jgi:shikimate kinase